MYYIGTKNQVDYYNDKVEQGEDYNPPTERWDIPIQHPTESKWAIVKHKRYTHSSMQLVEELSEDWYDEDNP